MIGIYGRVSTREQVEGYSIDGQIRSIREYLTNLGIPEEKIVEYKDEGYSARTLQRPQLKKLFNDISRNRITAVYVYKMDRWMRNMKNYYKIEDFFNRYDVRLYAIKNDFNEETAIGRFNKTIQLAVSQLESETTSERTLDGLVQSATEGNYPMRAPLGYKKVDNKLVIDEPGKEIVLKIFELKQKGIGVPTIQYILKDTCTSLGVTLAEKRIYRILKNKIYIGIFEKYGLYLENHSPAILNKALFEQVNSMEYFRSEKNTRFIFDKLVIHQQCNCYCRNGCGTAKSKEIYRYSICKKCGKYISEKQIIRRMIIADLEYLLETSKYKTTKNITQIRRIKEAFIDDVISIENYLSIMKELELKMNKKNYKNIVLFQNLINRDSNAAYDLIHYKIKCIYVDTKNSIMTFEFNDGHKFSINKKLCIV